MATTIDWPVTLPQHIEQSGYNEGNINNLIVSDMNNGPYKSRPKTTESYQPLKISMTMTTAERNAFYVFYKTTIAWGALSFNFPEPGVIGNTIETKITNFSLTPISGSQWRLTANFLVLV